MLFKEPKGIAEAFLLAENFISNEPVSLILGDNIFMDKIYETYKMLPGSGATVFTYQVSNLKIWRFYKWMTIKISFQLKRNLNTLKLTLLTGLYVDENVVEIAKSIKPSSRGELEISSMNNKYLEKSALNIEHLEEGTLG